MAGTIFEKSTTSLRLWFYAMYLMGSTRCGISAKQIQREIGVTYKTAWRMFKQIRTLMSEDLRLEGPTVEIDETYYGGVRKYGKGRPMRGDRGKTPIVGIVERKGRAIARATKDATSATLIPLVREYVLPESTVTRRMSMFTATFIRTRSAGMKIECHLSHFPGEEPDDSWIRQCAQRGWIIVTSDKNIEKDPVNRAAVIESKAKMFFLNDGESRAILWGAAIIVSRERIYEIIRNTPWPFFSNIGKETYSLVTNPRKPEAQDSAKEPEKNVAVSPFAHFVMH